MIMLTRLSGTPFVLNSDLIERIDATPDTVVTLADGTKYVVADSMPQVVDAVRTYRSEIVALSWQLDPSSGRTPAAAAPAPSHLATVAPLPGVEVEGTPEEEN
ncbi:flagellar FlbD family protein [Nocardioides jishulii]|uniref:Flagellar protein FlbD n=1 Tax=Nocardioides jishulii TaxID=2575440 RepID=A0A4U2YTW3_9ACTN|nr:flagellar FlbD family protein [Nocardioides jishulii]QCX28593.1 flagellar protein FlbD [Nocardioides jishulii]TKI64514.1 flagellar protein FlbD [Nocardioides jishulii]